ncbi:RICIN domain-containing protein [Kitasatospora sp. NPDC127111]|uniref:RICIN domain-containing protein n=1 Tax=Kitasatospora sp. NPDC127111 TaxID=3345363 RepID=UPI00362D796E
MNSTVKHRLGSAFAVLAFAATGALAGTAPASAADYTPISTGSDVEIRVQSSGKCLEVADWRTDDGAPVRQWSCTGGENQKWRFSNGFAVNLHSGKCLEIPGLSTAAGTPADQWTCDGGDNQRWGAVNVDGGRLAAINFKSDLVLDVSGGGSGNGAPAIQWYPTGAANQRLSFH